MSGLTSPTRVTMPDTVTSLPMWAARTSRSLWTSTLVGGWKNTRYRRRRMGGRPRAGSAGMPPTWPPPSPPPIRDSAAAASLWCGVRGGVSRVSPWGGSLSLPPSSVTNKAQGAVRGGVAPGGGARRRRRPRRAAAWAAASTRPRRRKTRTGTAACCSPPPVQGQPRRRWRPGGGRRRRAQMSDRGPGRRERPVRAQGSAATPPTHAGQVVHEDIQRPPCPVGHLLLRAPASRGTGGRQ